MKKYLVKFQINGKSGIIEMYVQASTIVMALTNVVENFNVTCVKLIKEIQDEEEV